MLKPSLVISSSRIFEHASLTISYDLKVNHQNNAFKVEFGILVSFVIGMKYCFHKFYCIR